MHLPSSFNPEESTYRDIEFITDDIIRLTNSEADIVETWTRDAD